MCCTLGPAKLTDTVLYAAEAMHNGKLVHVLGYQNQAQNLTRAPNAMILPFPAAEPMGPENVVDTTACQHILTDYAETVRPVTRGGHTKGGYSAATAKSVQVFDTGSYTVVLAEDARDIPEALSRVPANKRPKMNPEIFDAYNKWYPGWAIALCCFEAGVRTAPEPMLWHYTPKDTTRLFAPALDAHDGNPPKLGEQVPVSSAVVWGTMLGDIKYGVKPTFQDSIPSIVRPFLADKVSGDHVSGSHQNGDFNMSLAELKNTGDNRPRWTRVQPPGANDIYVV